MNKWLIFILLWTGGNTTDGPLARATRHMENEEWEFAVTAYEKALDLYPSDEALISLNLGIALSRTDSVHSAVSRFRLAASATSLDATLRSRAANNMGVLLFRLSQPVQALEAFREALRMDASNEDARFNYELLANLMPPVMPPATAPPSAADSLEENPEPPQPDQNQVPPSGEDEYIQGIKDRLRRWRKFAGTTDISNELFSSEQITLEQAQQILNDMRENEIRFLQQLKKVPLVPNPAKERPDW